jgi:hypothetical protein
MASKPEPEVAPAQPRKPTAREEYEFDLKGYSLTPGALSPAELAAINRWIDGLQPFKPPGEWYGHVETHSYYGASGAGEIDDGVNLQHVFEAGPVSGLLTQGVPGVPQGTGPLDSRRSRTPWILSR